MNEWNVYMKHKAFHTMRACSQHQMHICLYVFWNVCLEPTTLSLCFSLWTIDVLIGWSNWGESRAGNQYCTVAILLVEFMYLVLTRTPGGNYCRRLRSLMLCYDVFRALINSVVCWSYCAQLTTFYAMSSSLWSRWTHPRHTGTRLFRLSQRTGH